MIDYLSNFTNTNGLAFPLTLTVNATGPSATDGTEVIKLFGDDLWGARQSLMDYAGLVPDGVTEAPGTSQFVESIKLGYGVGPGVGVTWWLNDDPGTTGHRVLLLTGQVLTIASYTDLVSATYVGNGSNGTASAFFKTSDVGGTIRDTAGAFFVLPDMRGYVMRGLDVAASIDPDGASRDVGSTQTDSVQSHGHRMTRPSGVAAADSIEWSTAAGNTNRIAAGNLAGANGNFFSVDGPRELPGFGSVRTDTESRMINVATRFGITF